MVEAKNALHWMKEYSLPNCKKCNFKETEYCDKDFCECEHEALETAISALEKQVAKKSIRVRVGANDETDGCPICKNEFWEKVSFCSKCGQAISWGDES